MLGRGTECSAGARQLAHQVDPRAERHVADRGPGDDEAEGVDRVARVGRPDRVARGGDRLGEVGQALLRAQGHADLGLGVERHAEAAGVVAGPGARRPGMPREVE